MNPLHHWLCRSNCWRKTLEKRISWVLDGTDLGKEVLELGPGPGLSTDLLRTRVHHLTAIESDPKAANSLASRLYAGNVKVVTADATDMPFANGRFSGCVSFTMLHHIPSAELQNKLLREACRVLQPGGILAGSDSLDGLFMRVIHIGDTPVPVTPETFGLRLEGAGFEAVQIERNSHAFRFWARRPAARA